MCSLCKSQGRLCPGLHVYSRINSISAGALVAKEVMPAEDEEPQKHTLFCVNYRTHVILNMYVLRY